MLDLRELYARYQQELRPVLRFGPILGGVVLLAWRVRETRVPVTKRAIVIPPIAMSSAFFMFLSPLTLQTASVFYLAAFGMIVRWRTLMYRQFEAIMRDRPTANRTSSANGIGAIGVAAFPPRRNSS